MENSTGQYVELRGMPCSSGFVKAYASLIPIPIEKLLANTIWIVDGPLNPDIVVKATGVALGIIARTGGLTCHGAIIAREVSLPVICGVHNVQNLHGKLCILDGASGIIKVFSKK